MPEGGSTTRSSCSAVGRCSGVSDEAASEFDLLGCSAGPRARSVHGGVP
ncbi:hypothetical protein MUK42_17404 [Musa troglodytarum]|uniref:Uncharacterized protein n=1 Tax=Musa troglodytarum TaxID=320322 RepID=A0A9E7HSG7_9LILI|nr:hypothetical protein MUK42_17404 [Musa troglodytarum]